MDRGSGQSWDPGLQSERTRLAWVRTATALATFGLGGAGVVARASGHAVSIACFGVAALVGAMMLARTGIRFRRVQEALHGERPIEAGGDALILWIGVLAAVAGAVVYVIL
ncbi:DUF202 domain-containing protein [Herbidospora mongoliensis]|uniref:DUF202 domain-containing protein n=1 Tax=Herbidospora mongoliensis TaxID=688067 RepID=UPI0008369FFC|nr:DUF202 domain-containing protein [Herbidospora mongoliensis]